MSTPAALAAAVKAEARTIGFDLCGITTAAPFAREGRALADWVARGYHGEMAYMARNAPRSPAPASVESGARSLVVVALYYGDAAPAGGDGRASPNPAPEGDAAPADREPRGRISRYAHGDDYHDVMEPRLRRLAEFLRAHGARAARYYVDTGPVIDRAAALRAGIGWFGKNTMIITQRAYGSWVFLGEILTDLELAPDAGAEGDCGHCRICLDACPTGAIIAPYTVDARRCISYLTIEHRGAIPRDLRPQIGDHIFGCDICQAVCPHNVRTAAARHPELAPRPETGARPELIPLLNITEAEFRRRFRGSPVTRTKRRGLRRNVAVALGNARDPAAVPALREALDDSDALVRAHAAWALGRIGGEAAFRHLAARLAGEQDAAVRDEIALALQEAPTAAGNAREAPGKTA
ncbi:MAG TPA: tRNA epoxyqueuosine(34) reductase QueG [bacterium]|nr:tRNA epoxyqueuosine(34) reductase QueG [bacterium]